MYNNTSIELHNRYCCLRISISIAAILFAPSADIHSDNSDNISRSFVGVLRNVRLTLSAGGNGII